jgi:hypothetical protein
MCGRVRLFSDVSEIKLVFSILPHLPVAAERNIEALAVLCYDGKDRSVAVSRDCFHSVRGLRRR